MTASCAICRAQEMSRYVENGTLEAGLTGKDWIAENRSDVHVVSDLVYSKVSSRPARWVVAVPYESDIKTLEDLKGKKIATELVASPGAISKKRKSMLPSNFPGAQPKQRSFPVWLTLL